MEEPNGTDFDKRLLTNDSDLVSDIIDGEGKAVAAFYRWLYRKIVSRLSHEHGFSYDEAKELASELVFHIYQNLWQFNPDGKTSLVGWIYTIVHHRAVSEYRRRSSVTRKRNRQFFIYEMELRQFLYQKYPNFEDEIWKALGIVEEEADPDVLLLEEVLFNSLSEGDRSILVLAMSLGFEDAARQFEIKNDTARKRFKRALDRLRKAYLKAKGNAAS